MSKPVNETGSLWPHRIGVLLTIVVFPLIWVGGLVTTYDAGMAVPDWPNTYNYNMFAYPVRDWFFGPWDLFVEHGHRLLGSLAGIISIALVVASFRSESRKWVRWLSAAVLGLVIFQGILGGVRVLLDERSVAKIHGCVGPFFFALAVAFCVVTSNWWQSKPVAVTGGNSRRKLPTMGLIAATLLLVSYAQLVVGAFLRHIEVTASPQSYNTLVVIHLTTAALILLGTVVQFFASRSPGYRGRGVRGSINLLVLLVLIQIGLGLATWVVKYGWPVWFEEYAFASSFVVAEKSFWQMNLITAHVAVGSLILAYWTIHTLRCFRDYYSISMPLQSPSQSAPAKPTVKLVNSATSTT